MVCAFCDILPETDKHILLCTQCACLTNLLFNKIKAVIVETTDSRFQTTKDIAISDEDTYGPIQDGKNKKNAEAVENVSSNPTFNAYRNHKVISFSIIRSFFLIHDRIY